MNIDALFILAVNEDSDTCYCEVHHHKLVNFKTSLRGSRQASYFTPKQTWKSCRSHFWNIEQMKLLQGR
jgi:hypothetical protein